MLINNLEELLRHIDRHQENEDINEFLGLIEENRLPVDTTTVVTKDELIHKIQEAIAQGDDQPGDAQNDIDVVRNGHIRDRQGPDFPSEDM